MRSWPAWFAARVAADRSDRNDDPYRFKVRHGYYRDDTAAERWMRHLEDGFSGRWGLPNIHLSDGRVVKATAIGDDDIPGIDNAFYITTHPDVDGPRFETILFVDHIVSIEWVA